MDGNSLVIDVDDNELYRSKILPLSIKSNGNSGQWKDTEEEKEQKPQITLSERLGLEDFLSTKVWQASLVELLGTTILVFMIGTIAISTIEINIGGAPTLVMSILIGITLALLVLATMPISGGHLNPVISMSIGLMGLISLTRAFMYILAQCIGGILGALALKVVVNSNAQRNFSLGGCTITAVVSGPQGPVTSGLGLTQAFSLELICCFVFLFVLRWIAFDQHQVKNYGLIVVCSAIGVIAGLNIFLSTTVTGVRGYSGAGMNPARCLGPAIVRGGNLWTGHWIFWVAPAMASLAFYISTRFISGDQLHPEENIHDFANILKALTQSRP